MSRTSALVSAGLALALVTAPLLRADGPERPHAERKGSEVKILPEGPKFEVPAGWVEWDASFHNNFYVTTAELDGAKDGGGEWDTEYADVTNGTLDFARCGFQGGGDGWGAKGASFGDLQMRVYVLDEPIDKVDAHVAEAGAKAVAAVMGPKRTAMRGAGGKSREAYEAAKARAAAMEDKPADPAQFPPERSTAGEWKRCLFTYTLMFGDYGATAHVDFRLRAFGTKTVAAVFLYTDFRAQSADIDRITASFAWPNPPEKK